MDTHLAHSFIILCLTLINVKAVDDSVIFFLRVNKQNPPQRIQVGNANSVTNAGFYPEKPLKIIIHGFTSNCSDTFSQMTSTAYLSTKGSKNIICVDWGALSEMDTANIESLVDLTEVLPKYNKAKANTAKVGEAVANLVEFLKKNNLVTDLGQIHIIGFSLGAHISGIAGHKINEKLKKKVGRITGLDPAGPGYTDIDMVPLRKKLDKSDAAFVDVIHTNDGVMGTISLVKKQLGHVDFFPNGGSEQPGCNLNPFCNHGKAHAYFVKSILNPKNPMLACPCKNPIQVTLGNCKCTKKIPMGQNVPKTARGMYYLKT